MKRFATFTSLAFNLQLTGGGNCDLDAYLVHSGNFSILLDRVGTGVSGPSSVGNGGSGMNVTLGSSGNSTFSATPAGSWRTDNTVGSLAPFLSADLSRGGVTTVQGWGLQMDIVAVPEVETWVAAAFAGAFGACWINRQLWASKRAQV